MAVKRLPAELGPGMALRRQDSTGAACHAGHDAPRDGPIAERESICRKKSDMPVTGEVGVQQPHAVNRAALGHMLPHGRTGIRADFGGLDVTRPHNGNMQMIAPAAVEAFLPKQG